MILGTKPSDIAAVPDQQGGHDWSYSIDLGDGCGAGGGCCLDSRFGRGELGVEFADVVEEFLGHPLALGLHLIGGSDGTQQLGCSGS
jgi:hypothetical protein